MLKAYTSKGTGIFGAIVLSAGLATAPVFAGEIHSGETPDFQKPSDAKRPFSNTVRTLKSLWRALPDCSDARVVSLIEDRAHWAEKHTWRRGNEPDTLVRTHQHSEYIGFDGEEEALINRRYCHADAIMTNGKKRRIYYMIEEGQGFASFGWNVEHCISGQDRWRNNDGNCRTLRR